jgi:hypothetical protein
VALLSIFHGYSQVRRLRLSDTGGAEFAKAVINADFEFELELNTLCAYFFKLSMPIGVPKTSSAAFFFPAIN